MQVLSEYYGEEKTAQIRRVTTNGHALFEVMWGVTLVGQYQTEQQAENAAENYALSATVSQNDS